jgi:hypothetical protein
MEEPIKVLTAERDSDDGLIVTFSDGTITGYVVEELLELRPHREPTLGKIASLTDRGSLRCSI